MDDDAFVTPSCSLSIPYFKGDHDGILTDAVTKAIALSGSFHLTDLEGAVILKGKVLSDSCENIGYQYDRHPVSGRRIHRLVPNEGRREVTVEVTLVDGCTGKVLHGPFTISAFSDYDFVDSDSLQDASFINRRGARESVLSFSLGQLDSMDGAKETARVPVYHRLGVKIAEGIANLSDKISEKKDIPL